MKADTDHYGRLVEQVYVGELQVNLQSVKTFDGTV